MMSPPTGHSWIVFNGDLIAAGQANVSPLSDGFMYGLGLFETIKVLGGRPVFFDEHFNRLRQGATELGLPFAPSLEKLQARCAQCIAANQLVEGALKIVAFQDAARVSEFILARPDVYPLELYSRGFRLKTVRDGRRENKLFGLKTLNHLGNLTARREARSAGFDDALFVDASGQVLEGATSNVFVVHDGIALTPPLDTGILPGIARSRVLQLLKREFVREAVVTRTLLFEADEVFVTNSLLGVMPVARVDEHRYDVNDAPVTRSMREAFRTLESQSVSGG